MPGKSGEEAETRRERPRGVGGCAKTGICQIPSTPESVPVARATDLRGPIMRPILVVLLRLLLIFCVQARLAAYLSRCRGYILEVLETTRQESRGLRKAEHLGGKQTKSGYVASCCKILSCFGIPKFGNFQFFFCLFRLFEASIGSHPSRLCLSPEAEQAWRKQVVMAMHLGTPLGLL